MGPVHSPAAVTIPIRKPANRKTTPKATEHTKTQPNKNKHQNHKKESDRRSSSVTIDEKEVIALYQLEYWYGETKQNGKQRHKNHIAIPLCERSNTAHAETRDPPSQDPRDHIEQAFKA